MKQITRRIVTMILAAVIAVTAILMTAPDSGAVTYKKLNLGTVEAKKWKTSSKIKAPVITSHKVIRRTSATSIANLTKKNEWFSSWRYQEDVTWKDEQEDLTKRCYTSSIDKTDANNTITIKLSWNKVSRATGYEVRAKQTYAGKTDECWRYVRTKSNNVNLYTYWKATGLGAYFWFASDASYKIQVRAYKKVGKTYQYGKWSDTIKITGNETIGDVTEVRPISYKDGLYTFECKIPNDANGVILEYALSNGEEGSVSSEEIIQRGINKYCVVTHVGEEVSFDLWRVKAWKNINGEKVYSKNWYDY